MALAGAFHDTGPETCPRPAVRSQRPRENLALALGQGLSNAEIADVAYMSTATVKAYVSRLLEKLQVTNRVRVALLVQQADIAAPKITGPRTNPDPSKPRPAACATGGASMTVPTLSASRT